jgi:LacI family transcriptional regulator
MVEADIKRRFSLPNRPDAIISGSTTGAMAAVAGAEANGLHLAQDFDIASKEAIKFLHRFRKEMIVVQEDVNRAGNFLASAIMAAIEGRAPEQGQELQIPTLSDFKTA